MQAEETIDVESIETRVRGACFISGCPCKDARIVSYRRAGFFAFLARGAGQTAGRFVPVEAEWRLPMTPWTDLQSTTISDPLLGLDDREDLHQAPTSIHSGIER
jgi:hypothetical protein